MRIMKAAMVVAMATATLAAPALAAGPGYAEFTVKVQTADLDLTSAAGQQTLLRRLDMAVTRLCGYPVFQTREEREELAACRSEAMAAAAPQIDAARARQAVAVASTR